MRELAIHAGDVRELVVLAHVPTASVSFGFLPAARTLGLRVSLLTDQPESHRRVWSDASANLIPDEIIACDVFNPLAVIETLTRRPRPAAVFSNSDHLQASTSLVAAYFGLPGKDWQTAYRAKNKTEMRRRLAALGLDSLWHAGLSDQADLARVKGQAPYPCVVKPEEGVASEAVSFVTTPDELEAACYAAWDISPGQALLVEEYLNGPLCTLETLGDGKALIPLGGFRTQLSPLPHFTETRLDWGLPAGMAQAICAQVRRFGVGFGACHTEFVLTDRGPRLIEINYRNIGDECDFLLQDILGVPLFEIVLRLYLGEPLPMLPPAPNTGTIRYFCADTGGTVAHAPDNFDHTDGDVRLAFRTLVRAGERISFTHSNRDYLGLLRAVGPDAAVVNAALERTAADIAWAVQP